MFKVTVKITESWAAVGQPKSLSVDTYWTCADPNVRLDRHDGLGWGLPAGRRDLADRLVKAIEAGKVFQNPRLSTDVNNRTYVTYDCKIYGRHMNRDLTAIGF